MPVGLASVLRGIPFITHDSDALPGLANRLVSRWAKLHATALPASSYRYPKHKTRQVGVIVAQEYKAVNNRQARIYKKRLRLPDSAPLLLITGGSLGAARLNKSLVTTAKKLLVEFETLQIIHQVGKGKAGVYGNFSHDRLQVMEFLSPMFVFTGAADVIVTRAGANTMAELGTQAKACIVVPNPDLTGGHQLKNANALESKNAIIVIKESDIAERLHPMIIELLNNPSERLKLGKQHKKATVHNAARQLASILLTIRKRK